MPRNQKLASKAPKPLPRFVSEAAERAFWETHDTAEYLDWSAAQQVCMPKLKPSTQTISLRLPAAMLADLKVLADKRDVPYQSLLKMFLADRIAGERARTRGVAKVTPAPRTPAARREAGASRGRRRPQ